MSELAQIREPRRLRAEIVRSPHRSTTFALHFDISGLMDDRGRPLVRDAELEEILVEWCQRGIRDALARGRAQAPGHP